MSKAFILLAMAVQHVLGILGILMNQLLLQFQIMVFTLNYVFFSFFSKNIRKFYICFCFKNLAIKPYELEAL